MSKWPGVGVMFRQLAGNEDSVNAFKSALNKEIASIALEDDELRLRFTDGSGVAFFDNGQSCCESRYMRSDDDLPYFVGSTLIGAEIRPAPDEPDEYGTHEVEFLVVTTSKGSFTMASHNEHNGYYGGFSLKVKKI